MKAILLAAGKGSRISKTINNVPKSTLLINNEPLIHRTVRILLSKGIEVAVCVGYEHDLVEAALSDLSVRFYYNPFFDITNSIASLWFAKEFINDDIIIMNADVFLEEKILYDFLKTDNSVAMLVDKTRTKVGDYFFKLDDNNCILKYGKQLEPSERSCEYVGVGIVRKNFINTFNAQLVKMVSNQDHHKWWEDALYEITKDNPIPTVDVDGFFWSEIDYYDDYERIIDYINQNKQIGE